MDFLQRNSSSFLTGMSILVSQPSSFPFEDMGTDVFLNPILLRFFTGSLHLVLFLLVLIISCLHNFVWSSEDQNQEINSCRRSSSLLYYRPTLYSSLGLSILNLILSLLNIFYWYTNEWSDEKIITSLDLGVKTLAWFSLYLFLQMDSFLNSSSGGTKYPLVLRLWWGLFLSLSCYCLVIDCLYFEKHSYLSGMFWISDIVSSVAGLFLCCIGFLGKKNDQGAATDPTATTGLGERLLQSGDANGPFRLDQTVTPHSKAGVLSLLTFSWMSPLISLGHKKTLDLPDVPKLDVYNTARGVFRILNAKMETYQHGESRERAVTTTTAVMLAKGLVFTNRREIAVSAVYVLVYTLASYVGPYLIDTFIQYLNGRRSFKNEGYVLVFVFSIAKLFESLSQRQWRFIGRQVGCRTRAALVALIYNKGLSLSCQSKQGHTTGEIINIMSVDAERIGEFSWYMHDAWIVVIQVGLALSILYKNVGPASIAGLFAIIFVMLANVPLGKLQARFQDKLMKAKDERMKSTSEVLKNMSILKLQAWEMKFLSKILHLRSVEEGWLKMYLYTSAVTTFIFWGAPTFVSVVTFVACMLMGIPLELGKILSTLATFSILQGPIYKLPQTISMIVQTKVSLYRIASCLSLDDLPTYVAQKLPVSSGLDTSVEVVNGNFSWDTSSNNPTLTNINFRVPRGMRVAICGEVGSGKSSVISCILGEIPKISGVVRIFGRKAYVAQSPWIQSGTIKENILFGTDMDRHRYDRVVEACSLNKDLDILAFGDQTVIGERGINLSGGQKQRIQIARAIYQDADIYLFDDPFSAVDAHTGTHLFNECIMGLLVSKTVIFVTHQVEFLPHADLILVMKDGKIKQAGKYNDILELGSDFMELVGAHEEALLALDSINVEAKTKCQYISSKNDKSENDRTDRVDDSGEAKAQIVQEEEREKGTVGVSVYWKYITKAYGGLLAPFVLLAQIVFQVLQIGSNYWMAWATPVSDDVAPPVTGSTLIIVYVVLSIGSSLCILARESIIVRIGFKTAVTLFEKMHRCIFRAPMSFFDSTPSGRILNRASTDQSVVDTDMASLIARFAFAIIQLVGIIMVMSQVAWQVFVVFIPAIAVCVWLQQYYIPTSTELTRLCGVYKAPLIQHFSETLSGSSTIRSFDLESRFRDLSMKLIDEYSRPKFHVAGAMEWFCFRLDMLSVLTFAFSLIFLVSLPQGTIDPSIAGLAVTYGLNLNTLQASCVMILCYLQTRVISVERILQYTCIPVEPPLVVEANRPQSHWPFHGEVNIHDLQVRYAPHMPFVLRGLTCTFFGGKRTGIVGRTGSGKSTLIQTLFRNVEPTVGHILIDGVDITTIGLHDLRSRLSIIPQDPTMFEGTVRSNMDPLEEYTDEQIWEALDKCQLGDGLRKKSEKLDCAVSENGANWSVGQRQLVCLGRVLLKKSKVLVLDEATASVDTATDNVIQQTLKQHFTGSTVLTIAHRITSVLDSNMVLLLDNGLVKEYDTPEKLLEDKSSSFAMLVAEYSTRSSGCT
ncbi:Canalicular multispecific organic anion transporter 2 [Orobanche gracilis]